MRRTSVTCVATLAFIWSISQVHGQQVGQAKNDSMFELRAAGELYRKGWLHNFIFGKHYRDEWATPIKVPCLDLGSFAGGLTPTERGGGKQTKSLRLEAANGKQYQFRSVDKDPAEVFPPEFRETVLVKIMQDQISVSHPYGALVVPPLAKAAGVLHVEPQLFIMPDDERLGEFREEFAGIMGMIEERPADGPKGTAGFAGSDKIEGTLKLWEKLEKESDDFVDQKAFLRARLLDIYLGDWDRHVDQWRWARFRQKGKEIWLPIPRDRDQAFAKFDGLLPALADEFFVPQFEGFNKKKPDISSLTYSGRHMDRIFLNELTKDDFNEVHAEFVRTLTDGVIAEAVRRLPEPVYNLSGPWLERKLKDRRQLLMRATQDHYRNLAKFTDIIGRDESEYAEITRVDDNQVEVKIFERGQNPGEEKGAPLYHRLFKRNETKEIRLYLLAGNDKVMITGPAQKSILLRIIGGPGDDVFIDAAKGKTIIYDTYAHTELVEGGKTQFKAGEVDSVINAFEYQPRIPDHGKMAVPVPSFSYNSDDGLFLGAGVAVEQYGFRKIPYAGSSTIKGSVALATGAFRLGYEGDYIQAIGGLRLHISAFADRPRIRNYYGLGNDSRRDNNLEQNDFYRIRSKELMITPLLHHDFFSRSTFYFGAGFKRYTFDDKDNAETLIVAEQPYGLSVNKTFELTAGLTMDFREPPALPRKGSLWSLRISYVPKALDNDNPYAKGFASTHFYVSPTRNLTLAFGGRAVKLWGTFPYYDAAYIGGAGTLRGFPRERFAGDAAVDGVVAAGLKLFRYYFLLPTDWSIFVLGDAGRVWLDGESPGDWHTSFGGGVTFSPAYRQLTLSIGVAQSVEGRRLNLSGGFKF